MKLKLLPAFAVPGAVTIRRVPAAALTMMGLLVPLMPGLLVSVALMVWLPAFRKVALKVPVPPVRPVLSGRLARLSVLEKVTMPA